MKKNPWLEVLENLSLLGSGVGAVASILLNQASFAVAPLSLALVLGVLNRNRHEQVNQEDVDAVLAELDQRLSLKVSILDQQVSMLPEPETIERLKNGLLLNNRELANYLSNELVVLQDEFQQQLEKIEKQGLESVRQELQQVSEKYSALSEGVAQIHADLNQHSDSTRVDMLESIVNQFNLEIGEIQTKLDTLNHSAKPNLNGLQEHLARLDRQFSKLPPPADVSSLRQEVAELVRMITDLVPRRDMTSLTNDVKELRQRQETLQRSFAAMETVAVNLRRVFSQLPKELPEGTDPSISIASETGPEITSIRELQDYLASANVEVSEHERLIAAIGTPGVYPELQELASGYLSYVRSQLEKVQQVTETLATQQKHLQDQVNQLPKNLDAVAIQRQLNELSKHLPLNDGTFQAFKARVQTIIHQELQAVTDHIQSRPQAPHAELIFDLHAALSSEPEENLGFAGSRVALIDALETTQKRLILILPWSSQTRLDEFLLHKLETFLSQKRQLDIGWCQIVERKGERFLGKLQRGWMTETGQRNDVQDTLKMLLNLKRAYPDYFQFKIFGTSENFLVSDESFAVLGINDRLRTSTILPDLELKLRTNDSNVIQKLVHRFDNPVIPLNDLAAYWNRAVTRHELGDRAGAISDFSHILDYTSDDAVVYNHRGLAYYDFGDMNAAMADFTQSIKLNRYQTSAYCNRGFIRSEQGDQRGAISDYSFAIQTQPGCAIAYFYRGMAWQKLENHHEAVSDYTEAIYLSPEAAVARYYRSQAWQKLQNYQGAMADLKIASELFAARGSKTNAEKAQKSLTKLRQLLNLDASTTPETTQNGIHSNRNDANGNYASGASTNSDVSNLNDDRNESSDVETNRGYQNGIYQNGSHQNGVFLDEKKSYNGISSTSSTSSEMNAGVTSLDVEKNLAEETRSQTVMNSEMNA